MTIAELAPTAGDLQRTIGTTETCTTSTVENLKKLLFPLMTTEPQAYNGTSRTHKRPATAAPRKGAPSTKPQRLAGCSGENKTKIEGKGSKDKVQLAIATNVINSTLKALTSAAKIRSSQVTVKKHTSRRSSNLCLTRSTTPVRQTPLQPISGNRSTPLNKRLSDKHRPSSTRGENGGLRAQAMCAHLAFKSLATSQETDEKSMALPFLQLEKGMSALIHKCIALEFYDLAAQELRELRKRFVSLNEIESGAKLVNMASSRRARDREDTIPSSSLNVALVNYGPIPGQSALLPMIITSQFQMLRLLSATGTDDPGSLLDLLSLKNDASPVNLILRQVQREKPETGQKACTELEVMAQLMSKLAEKLTSDGNAQHSLSLKVLVLTIRTTWWKMSQHRVNTAKEVWSPLEVMIRTFHGMSLDSKPSRYRTVIQVFEQVQALCSGRKDGGELPPASIYQALAEYARMGDQLRESAQWLRKARTSYSEQVMSPIQKCILACQYATLNLRDCIDSKSLMVDQTLLNDAAKLLSNDLSGDPDALGELLVITSTLRRTACFLCVNSLRQSNLEKDAMAPSDLQSCVRIQVLCIKYFVRYLGSEKGLDSSHASSDQERQRMKLLDPIVKPTIEGTSTFAKAHAKCSAHDWQLIDSGLHNCFQLVQLLRRLRASESCRDDAISSLESGMASLSQPYWCRYLHLRKLDSCEDDMLGSLKTSIDVLQQSSTREQLENMLFTRLEHYTRLVESSGDFKQVLQVCRENLRLYRQHGIFTKATESLKYLPVTNAFDSSEEIGLLARTLKTYLRASVRVNGTADTTFIFYDAPGTSTDERMALLAYQFSVLSSKLHTRSGSRIYIDGVRCISRILLDLTSETESPVIRRWLVVQLMYLRLTQPSAVDESVLLPIVNAQSAPQIRSALHSSMKYSLSHMTDSLRLLTAMEKKDADTEVIEDVLKTWSTMLRTSADMSDIGQRTYDIPHWQLQLELAIDYLEFHGLLSLSCRALETYTALLEKLGVEKSLTVAKLAQLSLQYIRLGYISSADATLERTYLYLQNDGDMASCALEWHLAAAQRDLESQNFQECYQHLDSIRLAVPELSEENPAVQTASDRTYLWRVIADAEMLHSKMAVSQGQSYEALLYARLAVKGYDRIWMSLKRRQPSYDEGSSNFGTDCSLPDLTDAFAGMSTTDKSVLAPSSSKYSLLHNAEFWTLVPRLLNGLLLLASRFAHACLFSETEHYLGEAEKIIEASAISRLKCQYDAVHAQHACFSGDLAKARQIVVQVEGNLDRAPDDRINASIQLQIGALHPLLGLTEQSMCSLNRLERLMQNLQNRAMPEKALGQQSSIEEARESLTTLSLEESRGKRKNQSRAPAGLQNRPARSKTKSKTHLSSLNVRSEVGVNCLSMVEADVLRQKAIVALALGELDQALQFLAAAQNKTCSPTSSIKQAVVKAEIQMQQGLHDLTTHPVFSILAESAISYPSILGPNPTEKASNSVRQMNKTARQRPKASRAPTRETRAEKLTLTDEDAGFLKMSQITLNDALKGGLKHLSVKEMYHMLDVLRRTMIIQVAIPTSCSMSYIPSTYLAFTAELGRMTAVSQKNLAVRMEQQILHKDIPPNDSSKKVDERSLALATENLDLSGLQKEYIDIIPPSWNVISITLNDSKEEIFVTKYRAHEAPFVLQIPLNRQNAPDSDDLCFGFNEARHELFEIIELANSSSQDARSVTEKQAKLDWWSARDSLDSRLKDLVTNVEDIWLGGFRGVFSQHEVDPGCLARFQMSLHGILQKHLPSRSKPSMNKDAAWVALSPHVLHLLVALGYPSDEHDVDDQILDLLYFVVDILQFNGERNAYDEIDFDSIVVETLDALRHYHRAISCEVNEEQQRHTILILDKHLHCFPWESLPCLRGQSVSRLPSLSCLRRRILLQQEQQAEKTIAGIIARRQNGAFILNPSGDLKNTQENFGQTLESLSGWEGTTQEAPKEETFKSYLKNSDIFLYFGHGSGGQYIRSRTINKLDKCAVTLLMGCSSGHLQEAGSYEPYGKPIDYMQAGCPALVANLWDVTDKDIDRFAQSVLEKWGLFGKKALPQSGRGGRGKGKGKVVKEAKLTEENTGSMSLDKAVAQSRDACFLKYLNGAAPVIYGVPVFLE
ncbi:uncharacterized protein KY384_008189 [Bacidia gigantensis]|uniref:uncharacterized protein n=1 Tax=Bacidia gigantensis TaxID=2732470 RepID=UPI001D054AFF|nr:uncharacterized protein KY384_008189 [Bacidia gigantensis]KAG8526760.1 hypothetical protein KY384_008189 [Bacidia gigantensis]